VPEGSPLPQATTVEAGAEVGQPFTSSDGGTSRREDRAEDGAPFVVAEDGAGAERGQDRASALGSSVLSLLVELGLEGLSTDQVLRRFKLGAQVVACDEMLRAGFNEDDVGSKDKKGPFFFTRPVELFILAVCILNPKT